MISVIKAFYADILSQLF